MAYAAPSTCIFSKQFFEKIEADIADNAPSSYILDVIVSKWNKEIETIYLFR